MKKNIVAGLIALSWLIPEISHSLSSDNVLVVVNKRMSGAQEIAEHYMQLRSIPKTHLLTVSLTLEDTMSRDEYDTVLKPAVIKKIANLAPQPISTLVTFYGVPFRVAEPELSFKEQDELKSIRREIKNLQLKTNGSESIQQRIKELQQQEKNYTDRDQKAAVDSELALVRVTDYPLEKWIENPYFVGFKDKNVRYGKEQVMLVSRLDGPDKETVRRIIDDSLSAEKNGLQGIACLDARWPFPTQPPSNTYQYYDASIHQAATALGKKMEVKLDDKESLFPPKSCENTALYAGWYSLGKYIDSVSWNTGSIGYHMASVECSHLRSKDQSEWCVQSLLHGAAATLGPVGEPYLNAFPPPNAFFPLLAEHGVTLGEAYLASSPYVSWQIMLIGDPLYRPFPPLNH